MIENMCPSCKTIVKKRKEERCPTCWTPLRSFRLLDGTTIWIHRDSETPPSELLEHWQEMVGKRMTLEHGIEVVFTIHPTKNASKYRSEYAIAHSLLAQADFDLELAKEAIGAVVEKSHKTPTTLKWVSDAFIAEVILAKARRANKKNTQRSQDYTIQDIETAEDVWS